MNPSKINWRDTGRQVRFMGIVDGRAAFLLILMIYHISWWTFGLAIAGIFILVLMERNGYSLPNAMRRLRILLAGPLKPANNGSRRSRSDQ